jgi:DNA-binding response OmpR family regulator
VAVILVVDDEPDIRLFVKINLELDGHEVMSAGNGREALDAIEARAPDLILLDVMMPEVDGWNVLEQLKASAEPAVKEIPVLMLTALSSDLDQVKGGIEGAVRYLAKPVSPTDLRAAVDASLGGDPEPVQRKRAQQGALARIARMEKGSAAPHDEPGPRLTRLEQHSRLPSVDRPPRPVERALLSGLTARQRELLEALRIAPSVTAAAAALEMSRSNIYASLRRIGRKLDVESVTELLERVRRGELDG